jgi:hypothetical protein
MRPSRFPGSIASVTQNVTQVPPRVRRSSCIAVSVLRGRPEQSRPEGRRQRLPPTPSANAFRQGSNGTSTELIVRSRASENSSAIPVMGCERGPVSS